jgi:hypothetical protein
MTDERLDPAAGPQGSLPEVVETVSQPEAADPAEPNRFATAGKLGAERVHQLIRLGQQYEQEHGLKRGRQRLRQLIQLGKRYEVEHGLAAPKRRRKRLSREDAWADFVKALARVVKPAYRKDVERLVEALRKVEDAPAAEPTPTAA